MHQLKRGSGTRPRRTTFFWGAALLAVAGWGCGPSQSDAGDDAADGTTAGPGRTIAAPGGTTAAPAGTTAAPGGATPGQAGAPDYAKDSVLVRFRAAPTASSRRSNLLARIGGTIEDKNNDGIDDRFVHIANGQLAAIRVGKTADVDAVIEELRKDGEVLYAERNYIVRALATPNDPLFPQLYGLDNTGQTGGRPDADIDVVEGWDESVGSSEIVVGVVDTGVDYNHEDLAANMWVNPGEIPDNGIDDDGNGVIDDVHGFNAITGSGDPFDDHSHGTHCSGTIGAVGNNGIGVAGVNWRVQIMAIKFLDSFGGGTTADAIRAIDYAVAQRKAGVNLRVLSNSWGGGDFTQAMLDAISAAGDAGILFVAAAGNGASDTDIFPFYPSGYGAANVVSVAATDHSDRLADFSNFGASSVDLGAPGVDVLSTTPGNTYEFFSGTSMATPHVAGVAALVLSSTNIPSVEELKDALLTSGDPIAALEGRSVSGRRLNAASALAQARIPRFNLTVTPPSIVVTQEETATYNIDVAAFAGFTSDVALSVTSDPPIEASVTITPVVAAPGTGTLTVATSQATARGLYSLTITGQSGTLIRSRTVSLRVLAPGDPRFGLLVSPTVRSMLQNDFTFLTVGAESFGLTGAIALSVNSQPEFPGGIGLIADAVTLPGGTFLIVTTDCETRPGDYTLTVTGTDNEGTSSSASAVLTVLPFGTTTATFSSSDTPIAVPDGDPAGIASAIDVSDDRSIIDLAVQVDIVHPSIGDLVVQLVGPDGNAVTLHDRAGGGDDDIHRTYAVPDFNGLSARGAWQLLVSDNAGTEVGTLDSWALHVTGTPSPLPPLASFFYSQNGLTFTFFDFSVGGSCTYPGPAIVAWAWDFGDGATSNEQNPIHTYAATGDYTVTLTVTDENGLIGSMSQIVTATPPPPTLSIFSIVRDPENFEFSVELRWSGLQGDVVDLYRNFELVDTPLNDGGYTDVFQGDETAYIWTLCEQFTFLCSNSVFVDLGPNMEDNQATVTTEIGGEKRVETVIIQDER